MWGVRARAARRGFAGQNMARETWKNCNIVRHNKFLMSEYVISMTVWVKDTDIFGARLHGFIEDGVLKYHR